VNRIDAVVTYQPLDSEALTLILDQQIADLQQHVNNRLADKCFSIEISDESRAFLLAKGTSPQYGARELKRAIHKYLTQPLATVVMERRIEPSSTVFVKVGEDGDTLTFETTACSGRSVAAHPAVLIVDDNRDFLRLLSLEFTAATPWTVYTAQSVEETAALSAAHSIDFALLDLLLPDGNGIDLGAKLGEQQPGIHVAIMTGAELSRLESDECRKSKFDVVNKPFLSQQIIDLVWKCLRPPARASA
jgi:CheY-like chemotaxis protein